MSYERKIIKISELEANKGQIEGLPKNPRLIKDERFKKLVQSIKDSPEFIELRELIVIEHNGKFVVIAGNQRLIALKELKIKEAPCKVLNEGTSIEKLKEYTIKDNVSFGEMDWEIVNEDWGMEELDNWGEVVEWKESNKTDNPTSIKKMKSNMTKSIKIDFNSEDFEDTVKCIKTLRDKGVNVGKVIKEALLKTI